MARHPLLLLLLGWLIGSFFGLGQVKGFMHGAARPVAA